MSEPQELQITEIQIAKLDVKPGETLLVQVPQDATRAQMQRLQNTVRVSVPRGVRILVTTENVKFSVVKETT
jgi:sRNA-binding protein